MKGFDEYYDEAVEPGKRERAFAWATAIGLQDVDGLKPSKYLLKTAKRHIEGEISQEDARRLVDEYYETKEGHDLPDDVQEADKVSARMISVINSPGFRLSPEYYIGLHKRIFDGVFPHAGNVREVELSKREWVLNGDTVQYTPSCVIRDSLEYDFDREKKFKYKGLSEDRFVEHFTSFISGIWQIHPFREGNTRTVAVFAIKYLRSKGFDVTNDLFADKSFYFRNALVRANYENQKKPVVGINVGINHGDVVANVVANVAVKLSKAEECAVKALLRTPHLTASSLAAALAYPALVWYFKPEYFYFAICAAAFLMIMHLANIKRIAKGEEKPLTIGGGNKEEEEQTK